MLSSKVQEIKEDAQEVADDITARAKATASDISAETRETLDNVSRSVADWAEGRKGELTARLDTTRLRTRRTVYERPMASLFVAAGAGALVVYWLTHRSPDSDQAQ